MNLHRLKVFAAVAEHKGITAASKKLHMTQPAVSIQLKQLEAHYELPLIEIIGKKVYLTEVGKKIHQGYLNIAKEIAHLDMEISELKGSLRGNLSIAVVSTAKYFIPKILGEFNRKHPHISIQLKVANRQEIIERLEKNLDDLVILSQLPTKMPIIAEPFLEDALVIAAEPNHTLAKKHHIDIKKLTHEKFIARESGSGTRMVMERLFQKHHLHPQIIMELGSNSAIKQSVMAGFGISIFSKMSIEQELILKKLVVLDIKNFPVKHPWYIVYSKGKLLSPPVKNFLHFIKN
jgi:DNA-binding transcriptional LysR family regulator